MRPEPYIDTGFDGHVHTHLCQHARGKMEEYVRAAIGCGLHTICFLEHLEFGITYQPRSWLTSEDFSYYFTEGERLKNVFKEQIKVLLGVEAGINPDARQELYQQLQDLPVDRIGISRHFFQIGDQHYNLLSRKKTGITHFLSFGTEAVLDEYFSSILQTVEEIQVNVVCHLDGGLRHIQGVHFSDRHYMLIEQILDVLVQKDIALEVNTSGFDFRGYPFPQQDILRLALKKGVLLQAGSDAHSPEQVGRYFTDLSAFLAAL